MSNQYIIERVDLFEEHPVDYMWHMARHWVFNSESNLYALIFEFSLRLHINCNYQDNPQNALLFTFVLNYLLSWP